MPDNYTPPKGFIKNIAIGLPGSFKLSNSPYDPLEDSIFIGRDQQSKKFKAFLDDGKKGIFLVTGFRGMGKTSFVRYVLNKYEERKTEEEKKKIAKIYLTIAQNQPTELDILKLITISVFDFYKKIHDTTRNSAKYFRKLKSFLIGIGSLLAFTLIFSLLIAYKHSDLSTYLENSDPWSNISSNAGADILKRWSYILIPGSYIGLVLTVLLFQLIRYFEKRAQHENLAYNRIKWLVERCNSSISEEVGPGEDFAIQGWGSNLFSGSEKKVKTYALSNPKEIEYELNQFLEKTKNEGLEFIFVFDELDKVDPAISKSYNNDSSNQNIDDYIENAYQHDLRQRKQAIINIIAGLKNFFTSADARFIFIAGREMFDASLADIADRQSSLSSIFTYIFNIESLLKEDYVSDINNVNASLSTAIESYLSRILLNSQEPDFFKKMLEILRQENKENNEAKEENDRIYFILQNFVSYLTYRSNGSPKKMIRVVHEFILAGSKFDGNKTTIRRKENNDKQVFLYFNYYNQYRLGFISYLYRPFQIQYGRSLKLFSDNIIVSTPYLFDHLLKFHPFAFSMANLELIPEVLSTNKTPSLREHIRQLIDYLGANHIRETEINLFDYKFLSRTTNEITFLSKVFEEESAAYNFTLDESYLVKLLVIGKIKIERRAYSQFPADTSAFPQIYSIAHLNGILGDLHFFDQEYDDAIAAYSDAIRPINNKKIGEINVRDYITLIKNKLKLGLCFEKIYSYEEALAFYSDCTHDARRYMYYHLQHADPIIQPTNFGNKAHNKTPYNEETYADASLNDLLSLINHAFIAMAIIQEKIGQEGITIKKLAISVGSFFKMVNAIQINSSRNYQVCANLFLLTGKLFYFKNSPGRISELPDLLRIALVKEDHPGMDKMIRKLGEKKYFRQDEAKRKPMLSLIMYVLCLNEVVNSRLSDEVHLLDKMWNKGNFVKNLLTTMENIVVERRAILTGSHYRLLAVSLSNFGDCILSMLNMKMMNKEMKSYKEFKISEIINSEMIVKGADKKYLNSFDKVLIDSKNDFSITDVIKCYYYSGNLYKEFGRNISYSYQYRKILYVLRLILEYDESGNDNTIYADALKELLIRPILEISSQNTGHTDRHMVQKAKDLGISENILANLSNHPETQEVHLLFNYIKLKLNVPNFEHTSGAYATQYIRLLDLDFHAKHTSLQFRKNLTSNEKRTVYEDLNDVTDYFYCMLTILQTLKIYGTDYMVGPSYLAYTHFRIGEFMFDLKKRSKEIYQTDDKSEKKYNIFMNKLKRNLTYSLGSGTFSSLDMVYHYRMARDLYRKTEQLHQAGNEYKKTIQEMTYLEDDFSDNAYHFGAALDRFKMINDGFEGRITRCDEVLGSFKFDYLFMNDETSPITYPIVRKTKDK